MVRYKNLHGRFIFDLDLTGVQKFHLLKVPRVGSISIFIALFFYFLQESKADSVGLIILASSIPVFLFGFLEDLTSSIGAIPRFVAAVISAGLAVKLLGVWLNGVEIVGIDDLFLIYPLLAISITGFAVSGITLSFNIIDGYNGLSGLVSGVILAGIAYVAYQVGDSSIVIWALSILGALIGFLVWNFPKGLIFLGNGSAYLVGFWIAELCVLLAVRNSEVSKWFPLLLCLYPIFETLLTIYCRIILKKTHPHLPDCMHLHHLIYRWIIRLNTKRNQILAWKANAITSLYSFLICLTAVIPAVLFWNQQGLLVVFSIFLLLFMFCCIFLLSVLRFQYALFSNALKMRRASIRIDRPLQRKTVFNK